jgi:hypothetical protein
VEAAAKHAGCPEESTAKAPAPTRVRGNRQISLSGERNLEGPSFDVRGLAQKQWNQCPRIVVDALLLSCCNVMIPVLFSFPNGPFVSTTTSFTNSAPSTVLLYLHSIVGDGSPSSCCSHPILNPQVIEIMICIFGIPATFLFFFIETNYISTFVHSVGMVPAYEEDIHDVNNGK